MAVEAHIVAHTHWDREWYHPVERFRQRLVALIDELLEDPPRDDESFLLDGQAIVLEDYLAVCPDRAEALGQLLREGRIEAGPWYVLADELIPSGEALVRNLLCGRRTLARLGATSPPVLYCPDSFGHPAALPSIAAGFGLSLIILWRGYGGPRWPSGDTIRWTAPSGERATVFHLSRDGYEFGSQLPLIEDQAIDRWQQMRKELLPRSAAGVLLIPNGADHHARQLRHRDAIALLERVGAADGVRRSSFRAFAHRLLERADLTTLPEIRGELRDSYGYTWTLQGTFATRAHEKRLNARAERVLRREAEPWAALGAFHGLGRTSRRPLVEAAWKTLLAAHPHDTLCGCSIDEVAAAMELRLQSATNQARGVRDDSILALLGHDPVEAREARDRWTPALIARNPAPRPRRGVAIIDVERFLADVPVGPGSSHVEASRHAKPTARMKIASLGPLQTLSQNMRQSRTESPRHYPDNDLVSVSRVAAWLPNVPAFGLAAFPVDGGVAQSEGPTHPVVTTRRAMNNGVLGVSVADSGDVTLTHADGARRIESFIEIFDEEDVGDLYTPAPRTHGARILFRQIRRRQRGPLRGELELDYSVTLGNHRRRDDVRITVRLILDAESPVLRLALTVDNRLENHRLRFAIRTDVDPGPQREIWADAAFGPVRRSRLAIGDAEAAVEQAPDTAPLHRYVSVYHARGGLTLFSDGLAEYEVIDSQFVVTLLRAVGELSKGDLPERPGHAAWPTPTPGAQCIGTYEAELAVMLHGPRNATTIDAVERAADDVLSPLSGFTLRSALRIPEPIVGVELEGEALAFSAVKESEDGAWMVLRCINLLDEPNPGRWRVPFLIRDAKLARFDETPQSELASNGKDVPFVAPARGIVTVLVR